MNWFPSTTVIPTCIWWSLAMLQTQVAAYLLHSPSPSDVNLTTAWRPPPRVAAPRVSALALRLHSVITAKRLQSTSGQVVSRIRDAGHPYSAMMSWRKIRDREGRGGMREKAGDIRKVGSMTSPVCNCGLDVTYNDIATVEGRP